MTEIIFPDGWQPGEVGITAHQSNQDTELINKMISQEMFDSISREVVEEIGVPAESLVSDCTVVCVYIISLCCFYMKTTEFMLSFL